LAQIKLATCQSKADLFSGKAESASKTKPRVAIHNYHSAIDAYKELPEHPLARKAIAVYRAKIKALEELANQNNQKVKDQANQNAPQTDQKEEKPSTQNQEWDEFMDDGKDWQKKNSQYDD